MSHLGIISILSLYSKAKIPAKVFLLARWLLTPYKKMANELPLKGKILDQGCGHGLLTTHLALSSKEREVIGFDHDEKRVELAQDVAADIPNLKFMKGSFFGNEGLGFVEGSFSGIALIDVMHYFSSTEQVEILKRAHNLLSPNGIVIFREVNPQGGLVSKWNRLYEKLATFSGFTQADEKDLTFRLPGEWENLLKEAHFSSVHSKRCSSILFADVLFIGVKK